MGKYIRDTEDGLDVIVTRQGLAGVPARETVTRASRLIDRCGRSTSTEQLND
jgi:acyl-CoA hydrolase